MTRRPTERPTEKSVRDELAGAFDVCNGCRRCTDLCGVFPTLFDLIEHAGGSAGAMTPAEQDRVVDACVHCTRCVTRCPYAPDRSRVGARRGGDDVVDDVGPIDIPASMLRAVAMRRSAGYPAAADRRAAQVVARAGRRGAPGLGRVGRRFARAAPGSAARRLLRLWTGLTATRAVPVGGPTPSATGAPDPAGCLFVATCLHGAHGEAATQRVTELVERNGHEWAPIECCGAPLLHAGDIDRFRQVAARNVADLANAPERVGVARRVVIAQPACARVVREEYPLHLGTPAASELGGRVVGLWQLLADDARSADANSCAETVPNAVTLLVGGHGERLGDAAHGHRLLSTLGVDDVEVVSSTVGAETPFELRATNDDEAGRHTDRTIGRLHAAGSGRLVVTDDALAAAAVAQATGVRPAHPIELVHPSPRRPSPAPPRS